MKEKKHIRFNKYKVFRHTTESKRKNRIGNNPEIIKRLAQRAEQNPFSFSSSTLPPGQSFGYSYVTNPETKNNDIREADPR